MISEKKQTVEISKINNEQNHKVVEVVENLKVEQPIVARGAAMREKDCQ